MGNIYVEMERRKGEFFQYWVENQKEKIRILEMEGFTRKEAIEMLKVRALQGMKRQ